MLKKKVKTQIGGRVLKTVKYEWEEKQVYCVTTVSYNKNSAFV